MNDDEHIETRARTFIVMYRDMPCTPDSFCSVHSRVTWRRTSFFLLAAVTTRTPRREEVVVAARALSALVLATLVRAASMASTMGTASM
jgi:hypothetical protein